MDKLENLFEVDNNQTMQEQTDRFLLQINRAKLPDYVACGIIAPDKYLDDEIEHDIQSKNPNILIFSSGYIDTLDDKQILIEIIFTESEKERLQHVGDIYYYDMPLSLTRIKKIHVQNNTIKKNILKILDTRDAGFLPANLFEIYKKKDFNLFQYSHFDGEQTKDYSEKIRCYDGRMGMFSFIKNVGIYYSNDTGTISNYTEGYFLALIALLNQSNEEKPLEFLNLLREHREFKDFLYSDQEMKKNFIQSVVDTTDNEEIKEIFAQLLLPNKTVKTLEILAEKKAWYHYCVALVYYFRHKTANRKDGFKVDVASLIPQEIAQTAFAILGIYLGYSNLRASENFESQDKYYKKLFGSRFSIKNELASKPDYILMESVYQTCFYEYLKIDIPSYLEYPTTAKKLTLPKDKKFNIWYKVEQKEYFDTSYVQITKRKEKEVISEKLEKYGDEIVFGKDYLASFIDKHFMRLISYSKEGKPCKPFCKKSAFLEVMDQLESNRSLISKLFSVFEIDKK